MKFALTLLACLLIAATQTFGYDTCLSVPPNLAKGSNCGGAISCQFGLYCDTTAVCSTQIAVGSSCNFTSDCVFGSSCRGVTGQQICVANANPGDQCAPSNSNSTLPVCGGPLSCISGICTGGSVGDSCKQSTDCSGTYVTCNNNLCTAVPNNGNCTNSQQCSPTSYCTATFFQQGICLPKITSGVCTSQDQCAFSYICSKLSVADTQTQCLAAISKKDGEYCTAHGECVNKRCANNYCAKSPLGTCTSDDDSCAYDQFCGCSNIQLANGFGTCTANPCWSKYQDFLTCFSQNCVSTDISYAGSCVNKNCQKEGSAYQLCSPAGTLTVSFISLLFTLIAVYILKN